MVSNTGTAMVKNMSLSWPIAAAIIIPYEYAFAVSG